MHVPDSHKIKKEKGVRNALGTKNEDVLWLLLNLCYYCCLTVHHNISESWISIDSS